MRFILIALVVFVLWTYSEVTLLLFVAQQTNIIVALLLTIGTGMLGIAIARTQGWLLLLRIRQELGRGEVPVESLLSGGVLFVAGILLLIPGLLSDLAGILLLLPPLRRLLARRMKNWFQRKMRAGQAWVSPQRSSFSSGGDVVDSYRVPPEDEPRLRDDRGAGI